MCLHVCVSLSEPVCVCPDISPASHFPSHLGYQPCTSPTPPSVLPLCCRVHAGFAKSKASSRFSSPVRSLSSLHLHSALLSVSCEYASDSDVCLTGRTHGDAVNAAKKIPSLLVCCFLLTCEHCSKWGDKTLSWTKNLLLSFNSLKTTGRGRFIIDHVKIS